MLDNWTKKKMTGFKLIWKIEDENPPVTAATSEVGQSIQTPELGDTFVKFDGAFVYKAVLKMPEDFPIKRETRLW